MTAIVSPKPRHAKVEKPRVLDMPVVPTPPIYVPNEPRVCRVSVQSGSPFPDHPMQATGPLSPPRLMSPINLLSSGISNSKLSKSQVSCSSNKRRRACQTSNTRSTRRRHPRPAEGPLPSFVDGPPVFDRLRWISQVEMPPERVDVWDIADLSLLPVDHQQVHPSRSSHPSSGVGPVRHRKSSLRSGGNLFSDTEKAYPSVTLHHRSQPPASSGLLPAFESPSLNPRTPPPMARLNPNEATFRNLMPAFPLTNGVECCMSSGTSVPTYSRGSSATPPL